MIKMKPQWKPKTKRIIFFLIIFFFLSIKITQLFTQKGVAWDSAVYIEMGKYIFSGGNIGLWEASRPLFWPFILGFFWKINLNPIIFGRIIELILAVGCIHLTYLIGKKVFDEYVGLLSSFFLAFSLTFLFYSSTILTGIPSTFFSLLGVYFFIQHKYLATGIFIGFSSMARFLQLLVLIPLMLILLYFEKKKFKNLLTITMGVLIISIPYLIINLFLYKNPIFPFILQSFMTKNTGWVFHQPLQFYFINLLRENFLLLFIIPGIILILKRPKEKNITILGIFLLFFLFFNLIAHKEMRFVIVFLPYMHLITAYGISQSLILEKHRKKVFYSLIALIILIPLTQTFGRITPPNYKEYPQFTDYLNKNEVNSGIWITNPVFMVSSNKKTDELIYYPLFDSKRISELNKNLKEAKHILIDTCDILPCPQNDKECEEKAINFLNSIKSDFDVVYNRKGGVCEQIILAR